MAKRKKSKTIGTGGVVLGAALSLVLAALLIYGLYFWGSRLPEPAAMRTAGAAGARQISLYTPQEPVEGEAPVPAEAPAPVQENAPSYIVDEVVCDEDGMYIAKIIGKRYIGYVAIIDDPLRLTLGKCPYFGTAAYGRSVQQMAEEAGAVLAVNGGGFSDIGGVGLGGFPTGNVIYQGEMLMGNYSSTVGMDAQGVLHVGEFNGAACLEMGLQWAVSYGPTLIQDGAIRSKLEERNGEPRTAIGQREDGAVVILVLQGRQVQALGVTCRELADIMWEFGCVNASNLDGGASSDIFYQGRYLNVCNTSGGPRGIPTSILVMPSVGGEG